MYLLYLILATRAYFCHIMASKRSPRDVDRSSALKMSIVRYEDWLRSRGVTWNESAVRTTAEGVVAGVGCVATRKIRRGEELFRVPRNACLGASSNADVDSSPACVDSQQALATLVINEQAKGENSEWFPLLEQLSTASCPWVWPRAARTFLKGTELEAVVQAKRKRLSTECAGSTHPRRIYFKVKDALMELLVGSPTAHLLRILKRVARWACSDVCSHPQPYQSMVWRLVGAVQCDT